MINPNATDTTAIDPAICPDEQSTGQKIAFLVQQLDQQILRHFDARVAEYDLTGPQALLVRLLEEPMPMQRIAGLLQCDPSNVTGIVDRLEARGIVERRMLPTDRRVKQIVLTPEGEQVQQCLMTVFDTIPGLCSLSESELEKLRELLERAVDVDGSSGI